MTDEKPPQRTLEDTEEAQRNLLGGAALSSLEERGVPPEGVAGGTDEIPDFCEDLLEDGTCVYPECTCGEEE